MIYSDTESVLLSPTHVMSELSNTPIIIRYRIFRIIIQNILRSVRGPVRFVIFDQYLKIGLNHCLL